MKFFISAKVSLSVFVISVIALFFYSFTQIDLSLTFSQASILQEIQKAFQQVGYFNRPVSTQLFFIIILLLSVSYLGILEHIKRHRISFKTTIILIGFTTIVLMVTYNAFSYDLFNYIFDAKIVTQYQENPYLKKALDYPSDPMLSFMRWTHRTYPYGPVWLGLTVPLSYAGLQVFAITFGLFKLLSTVSYLLCCYFIYRILKLVKPDQAVFGMAFFALNPLVIIESLVSAHNDIVMVAFALGSIYLLTKKHKVASLFVLLASIGIKFATVFLLPVSVFVLHRLHKKKQIDWENIFQLMTLCMLAAVFAASVRTNFQPWYLLYILPFASLVSYRKYMFSPVIFLSITALFTYVPYLFMGNWDNPIPFILQNVYITGFVVALIMLLLLFKQERKKHE